MAAADTIEVHGKNLFMSFANLNRLTSIFSTGGHEIMQLSIDGTAQIQALRVFFDEKEFERLSVEEALTFFAWVQDHVVDFFTKQLNSIKEAAEKYKNQIEELTTSLSSLNGSTDLTSKKASAGR